jgi:hypothetical protein
MEQHPTVKRVKLESGLEESRIRWGDSYPITLLGEPEWQLDLPGSKVWMDKKILFKYRDIVVLGERSCGIRDFLTWCSMELTGFPRLSLHGSRWLPSLAKVDGIDEEDSRRDAALDALSDMASEKSADGKADTLKKWAERLEDDFFIIIRDLSSLGQKASIELARAFRLIRDNQACPNLHILVGSSSESYLTDDLFSSFLPMTYRCRMRPFDEQCVRLLIDDKFGESARVGDGVVEKIVDLVGGQPFLTSRLLHRMRNEIVKNDSVDVRSLEAAFRLEKRAPHSVVQSWQQDLIAILKEHPELVEPMRAYVAGTTLGLKGHPPSDSERPLFVAGWLRELRDKRWGIASELHAALARPVLDRVQEKGRDDETR